MEDQQMGVFEPGGEPRPQRLPIGLGYAIERAGLVLDAQRSARIKPIRAFAGAARDLRLKRFGNCWDASSA